MPVVVLTAARLNPTEVAELGAAAFVTNPPERDVLIDTVRAPWVVPEAGVPVAHAV